MEFKIRDQSFCKIVFNKQVKSSRSCDELSVTFLCQMNCDILFESYVDVIHIMIDGAVWQSNS